MHEKGYDHARGCGRAIARARDQAGLSQAQVAKILECHRPTISQIESGQRVVRPDEIVRLAKIYGVKEAWIIKGDSLMTDPDDPRVELAARQLAKLRKSDLDAILQLIRVMRSNQEDHRD